MEDEDYFKFSDDILINSTEKIYFNDTSQFIHGSSATVLALGATDEIDLTATTIDINGAVAMDGAITGATNITLSGELDAATLDISGNADIDGTLEADAYTVDGTALNEYIADTVGAMVGSNTETGISVTYEDGDNTLDFVIGSSSITNAMLAGSIADSKLATISTAGKVDIGALEIDGASEMGAGLADADLFIVDDGAGGTEKSMLASRLPTYLFAKVSGDVTINSSGVGAIASDVIVNADINSSAAIADSKLATISTADKVSGAAIQIDDATDGTGITVADADKFLVDDGGTTKYITASQLNTYTSASVLADDIGTGDAAVTLTTSSGNITIDAAANNTDIIFKGTDATADITMLTLDGSEAGAATFNNKIVATELDISGDVDVDGTLETDALTINGVTLSETIADTVGAMVGSNTETGITVTYEDGDNTLDFVIGTLNQDTTGTADYFTATANDSTNETVYPVFVDGATGSQGAETDTGLTYNPSTGLLSSVGVTASGTITFGSLSDGAITATAFVDEDDMSSNSATLIPTQQSVKAYADSLSHLSLIDEDNMSTDSATRPPSQQSVKAYVDAQILTEDTLTELNDTNITSPGDSALLIYDTGTSTWRDYVVSGDITISDAGVGAIASDVIVNADIKSDAAIADSKLATISTADKVSGAAIQVDGATSGTGITLATSDKLLVDDAGDTKYINASQITTFINSNASFASTDTAVALAIALG